MRIDPSHGGCSGGPAAGRLGDTNAPTGAPSRSAPGSPKPFDPAVDRVEVSDAARELAAQATVSRAESTLEPARLRQVLDRVSRGFYERPEVRAEVTRRLSGDLGAILAND